MIGAVKAVISPSGERSAEFSGHTAATNSAIPATIAQPA
ncbi:Uncharacterised protein [Vibrio cholerae]|nr:Uncharacterised protein [Vibrio cholerae]